MSFGSSSDREAKTLVGGTARASFWLELSLLHKQCPENEIGLRGMCAQWSKGFVCRYWQYIRAPSGMVW